MKFITRLVQQSQATRLYDTLITVRTSQIREFHPLCRCFPTSYARLPFMNSAFSLQRHSLRRAFQLELFRVRSPLLTESLLISFPPLTDMLKFRG